MRAVVELVGRLNEPGCVKTSREQCEKENRLIYKEEEEPMKLNRRNFVGFGAAGAATLAAPSLVRAQGAYPNKPLQLVVPFEPGGGADRTARLFAPYLAEELGSPVNVVNIAGGGGWVAWQQMARWNAEDDDHMLGTINFQHLFSYLDPRVGRTRCLSNKLSADFMRRL